MSHEREDGVRGKRAPRSSHTPKFHQLCANDRYLQRNGVIPAEQEVP